MTRYVYSFLLVLFLTSSIVAGQSEFPPRVWGEWYGWGDQQDGTYLNPLIPADYSDLDCIRVENDYYAISSTMQLSPGMVVLHSKDMVNWSIIGHVVHDVTQIGPEMNWDRMNRYGRGVWAGAIRYYNGRFFVYFGAPDEGYFMSSADNPAGPWEPLVKLLDEPGWNDCCPFWDDDGKAYFVGTHFSDGYKIYLFEMTPDGRSLIKETGKVIYQSRGSEASKWYKINGKYYHLFSEVRPQGRTLMMQRAEHIWGPYEGPRMLSHAQRECNEPNQGGLLDTPEGAWYFLTHHGSGGDWSGRIMSLLPVTWLDGWPILGEVGIDSIGTMVWGGGMPVSGTSRVTPQTSDEFDAYRPGVQWEWNYQPRAEKWSLTERRGWLRLHAFPPLQQDNLLKVGNTLTQRTFRTPVNQVVVKFDLKGMSEGQKAGLCHFANPNYSGLGVFCQNGVYTLEHNARGELSSGPVLSGTMLWIKSGWGLDGRNQFYYSEDGTIFLPFGPVYQMSWGSYRGDRIGIYTYNNAGESGYVDVDYLRYDFH